MNGRVYRNIAWNGLFLIIQTLMTLAGVPLLLHSAGDTGYGLYAFFLAVVSASTLIQAGLDLAMSRSVARFRADGDTERLQADLSFGYVFCVVAGVVEALVILGLTFFSGLIDAEDAPIAHKLCIVFAVSMICNGPLAVSLAVLSGLEKFMARNVITTVPAIAGLLAAVYLLNADLGADGVVVYVSAVECTRFVASSANVLWVNRILPHLTKLSRTGLYRREVISFQAKQLGNQVADYLFYTSDRMILQATVGAALVAHYAVAERPNTLAQAVVSTPLVAIVPSLVTALSSGDTQYIRKVLTAGTRLYLWLTLPILASLLISATDLITLWVGAGYADSARTAQVFVVCLLVAGPFKIYSHYRLAEGTNGFMTSAKLIYAPVNAISSFFLAQQWGLMGVVIPTAIFYTCIYPAVWMISMAHRKELRLFVQVCHRPLMAVGVSLVVMFALQHWIGGPSALQAIGVAVANTLLGLAIFATLGGGLQARRAQSHAMEPEITESAIDLAAKGTAAQARAMS